jgi:hypothetical protein
MQSEKCKMQIAGFKDAPPRRGDAKEIVRRRQQSSVLRRLCSTFSLRLCASAVKMAVSFSSRHFALCIFHFALN